MADEIGTVGSIWRYPVKSFQGERVAGACGFGRLGIAGDRAFALRDVESGTIVSGKHPRFGAPVLGFSAVYDQEPIADADPPVARITIGDDEYFSDDAGAISTRCSEELGAEMRFEAATVDPSEYTIEWPEIDDLTVSGITADFPLGGMTEPGTFVDLAGLHVLTSSSIRHLAGLAPDSDIVIGRFRPSLVIDLAADVDGFVENDWTEREAALGETEIRFGLISPRCVMTTRPQPGLDRDLDVLKAIASHNRRDFAGMGQFACLGIYAEVTSPGQVRAGDRVVFV